MLVLRLSEGTPSELKATVGTDPNLLLDMIDVILNHIQVRRRIIETQAQAQDIQRRLDSQGNVRRVTSPVERLQKLKNHDKAYKAKVGRLAGC